MSAIYEVLPKPMGCEAQDPDYVRRMLHNVPRATEVNRGLYILERARDKVVLNLGSESGDLHEALIRVTRRVYGIDRAACKHNQRCFQIDLDDPAFLMPPIDGLELIVAGEVLEHLSNPGMLLDKLRSYRVPLIITAPNAHCWSHQHWANQGKENVNLEHVAYYSYWTLKGLLERYDFKVREFRWCDGGPFTAEGLVFLVD